LAAAIFTFSVPRAASATGTWTSLTNQPAKALDTCELLTDGTVMCHEGATAHWHRLSPDLQGSYVNGTWDSSPIADMPNATFDAGSAGSCTNCPYAPVYFSSAVLADGRVVVVGGEFFVAPDGANLLVWTNLGFLYDPVDNAWSGPFKGGFGSGSVGDTMGTVLQDGGFIVQQVSSSNLAMLNPTTLTFTPLNPPGKTDINDEEGLSSLPNGQLLTVEPTRASSFEIYNPATNRWGNAGTTPVNLADTDTTDLDGGTRVPTDEVGPAVLRPDGKLVYFTANLSGQNALYDTAAGTWSPAPSGNFPLGYAVQDGPASLLPNGNVLVMANLDGSFPSHFYEFTLATNTLQATSDASGSASNLSFEARMILLPSGEVLLTGVALTAQTYSNGGQPLDAWRPVIASAPNQINAGTTYPISGQLFNGFSDGAFYGDDAQSATNYPLVRITNAATGHVRYARTHDHSRMGVESVGSSEIVSTQFDVPTGIESGPSTLVVVANGIASAPVNVTVGALASAPAMGRSGTSALGIALALFGLVGAGSRWPKRPSRA
jgi:hypothetical protein